MQVQGDGRVQSGQGEGGIGIAASYPLLRKCVEESPVVLRNGFDYFVNPISDGVPEVSAGILKEAVEGLEAAIAVEYDVILAPEAMGIPLAAGLSLRTGIPYSVVRKKGYGLPGEIGFLQRTGYSESRMYLNGMSEGRRALIVDDVLDTGGTLLAIADAVRRSGATLAGAAVVFSVPEDLGEFSRKMGAPVVSVLSLGRKDGRPYVRRRARTRSFYLASGRRARVEPAALAAFAASSLAGAGLGAFSGLVPGIHVNALAAMLLASCPAIAGALSGILDPSDAGTAVCCCIMSASVVHSFLDFVPSVFVGAPDSEDCVSVLPGHRLLLEGRGMAAVRSAAVGSLVGTSAAILLAVPLQWAMLSGADSVLDGMTPVAVSAAATVLVISQFRKGSGPGGIAAFLVSGALGAAVMHLPIPSDGVLGEGSLMFPLLTGLFGVPVLMGASSGGRIPPQRDDGLDPDVAGAGLRGVLMGCVAGWFPGITATVGASVSACFLPENRPDRFIASVASIGSVTAVLSLVTLSVSGSGRSGTALAIGEIAGTSLSGTASEAFLCLLVAAAIGSACGYVLTIRSGMLFASISGSADQRRLSMAVLLINIALVAALTGPFGLAVLAVSSIAGHMPDAFGTDRTILSGCLLLPVILNEAAAWTPPWT